MVKFGAIALIGALVAQANVVQLKASLTGEAAVAGTGAAGGKGSASVTVNRDTGQVCYDVTAENLGEITAAHIHRGAKGEAGPPVVPLPLKTLGMKACVDTDEAIAKAIADNPAGYYVNVHTAQHPQGAIRGQLAK